MNKLGNILACNWNRSDTAPNDISISNWNDVGSPITHINYNTCHFTLKTKHEVSHKYKSVMIAQQGRKENSDEAFFEYTLKHGLLNAIAIHFSVRHAYAKETTRLSSDD